MIVLVVRVKVYFVKCCFLPFQVWRLVMVVDLALEIADLCSSETVD